MRDVETADLLRPQYMANKRSKLLIQNQALRDDNVDMVDACPQIFSRLAIYVRSLEGEESRR